MNRPRSKGAQTIAVLAALLVLALSIAVYTPLHRHEAGSPFRCTLNNVDQSVAEVAVFAEAALIVLLFVAMAQQAQPQRIEWVAISAQTSRGPPAC